ncbi:MAG: efflux RND transporter periplasmic adaptor subunit [Methylomonas sp.]
MSGNDPASQASQLPHLSDLANYQGPASEFWPLYLKVVAHNFSAQRVLLMVYSPNQPWQAVAQAPLDSQDAAHKPEQLLKLAEQARNTRFACFDQQLLAVRLQASAHGPASDTVMLISHTQSDPSIISLLKNLAEIAAIVPLQYQLGITPQEPQLGQIGTNRLYDLMRLILRLGQEPHFMQLSLALCNDLAVRYQFDRVSLGWVEQDYVALSAVSHIEKFDRKSTAAHDLELVMEEALDQDAEIRYPLGADAKQVIRAHQNYARQHAVSHLMSIPLRHRDRVVAVMTLERNHAQISDTETWELGLITRGCVRQLYDLHRQDRSLFERLVDSFRQSREKLISPYHSAWKLGGIAASVVLAILVFCPWAYRVDAGLTLRSKDLVFIPAPFDGYLREVKVEAGDEIEQGTILAELDTRDLLLEESMSLADVVRYGREAQKAQASNQLADMQIALARQQQSQAHLDLVQQQLAAAQIRAPYAGIVVEGDLKKNLGSPLRKGDLLLKMAQLDDTYVEIEIDQVDIHEVHLDTRGEFALVGQPDQKFDLVIDRIEPTATQREGRNLYIARGRIESQPQVWWRPGMGGAVKLEVGNRRLIWVLTHRTVRFLRQVFWL